VAQEPSTTRRARALELLKATLATPSWLPTTKAKRLVWAIRGATVLGLLVLIASVVDKNLWDWLDLLIIPAVLAAGALLFNRSENRRAERQVKLDREIALGHRHDDALQAYLDRIS
jgi:hypothetical protein